MTEPTVGRDRPPHPLGPGVVLTVPDLPRPAGPPARRAAAAARTRPLLRPVPARRPDRGARRLPRGPARGRGRARAGSPRAGGSSIGPWMILMDEFMVSGETIVRDLQLGMAPRHRARRRDGGRLPARHVRARRADAPDPAAAGLEHAVVWRGVPADGHADRVLVGGARRLACARRVPLRLVLQRARPARRREAARRSRPTATSSSSATRALPGGGMLLMNGTDHQMPQPWLGPRRRRGERGAGRLPVRGDVAARVPRRPADRRARAPGPASCARARGPTC